MSIEEFKYSTKKILVEKKEDISSSYKIKSYTAKLKFMEERKIPQRPIKDVLNGLFLKNRYISNKTRNSIVKIIYSQKTRILILITNSGNEIITNRDRLIRDYGWFFFVEKPKRKEKASKGKKSKKKEEQKKEITLKTEEYHFKDSIIPVKEKENMRSLYQTNEYRHYLKFLKSQKISQSSP